MAYLSKICKLSKVKRDLKGNPSASKGSQMSRFKTSFLTFTFVVLVLDLSQCFFASCANSVSSSTFVVAGCAAVALACVARPLLNFFAGGIVNALASSDVEGIASSRPTTYAQNWVLIGVAAQKIRRMSLAWLKLWLNDSNLVAVGARWPIINRLPSAVLLWGSESYGIGQPCVSELDRLSLQRAKDCSGLCISLPP